MMRQEGGASNRTIGDTHMAHMEQDTRPTLLSRQYLCDEVTRIIKLRIFNLEYPRGSRLLVENLANDLNVSMTPVREGLRSLVAEGLVLYDGKRYSVFNPTEKEINDIFNVRRMLERLAAMLAARHMREEDVTYLLELFNHDELPNYIENQAEFIKVDKIFHAKILEGADNARLGQMLATVVEQCWLIRRGVYSHVFPLLVRRADDRGSTSASRGHPGTGCGYIRPSDGAAYRPWRETDLGGLAKQRLALSRSGVRNLDEMDTTVCRIIDRLIPVPYHAPVGV